jgi:hypothetical protein
LYTQHIGLILGASIQLKSPGDAHLSCYVLSLFVILITHHLLNELVLASRVPFVTNDRVKSPLTAFTMAAKSEPITTASPSPDRVEEIQQTNSTADEAQQKKEVVRHGVVVSSAVGAPKRDLRLAWLYVFDWYPKHYSKEEKALIKKLDRIILPWMYVIPHCAFDMIRP